MESPLNSGKGKRKKPALEGGYLSYFEEKAMDIDIKDVNGNRVGYVSGSDINDTYGNKVGYVNGSDINDTYGNKVGYASGSDIKDVYGNRVGYVSGSDIKDTYGNKVGYAVGSASNIGIIAAALLLFDLEPEGANNKTTSYSGRSYSGGSSSESYSGRSHSGRSSSEESGCLGAILGAAFVGILAALKAIFSGFVHYFSDGAFDFKGSVTRKEWWVKCLLGLMVIVVTFLILGGILFGLLNKLPITVSLIIFIAGILFVMVPIAAASVRRMHDLGKRWWWVLIPIVGFVMCAFFPSKTSENPYI